MCSSIVTVTEQGEKLLLRDMGGILLIIPPASNTSEGSWSEEMDDLSELV